MEVLRKVQEMIRKIIKKSASSRVTDIFNADRKSKKIKKDRKEISEISQVEAKEFYRSGKIFLLPVCFFEKKDLVEHIYKETFLDIYTRFSEHYQLKHSTDYL